MSIDLKRQLIARMRDVQHLLDCHSERPGGMDPGKLLVVVHGDVMTMAAYAQQLEAAYTDQDEDGAKRLLAVVV